MNSLLLNREGFSMPVDGWYQLAPVGEFGHAAAGVVQVVDREACEAMVQAFRAEAQAANFAGLLVDFDHFSLDGEKRSEAAGWIVELDCRLGDEEGSRKGAENAKGAGLWAKIRWSDVGEEAVKGGRYRFLSPVWSRGDCADLGPSAGSGQARRVRPVRLLNAAVTNDPNLKGMRPLSNRSQESGDRSQEAEKDSREDTEGDSNTKGANVDGLAVASGQGGDSTTKVTKGAKVDGSGAEREALENSGGGAGPEARFKWVLGASPEGRHCPSCLAVAGQVHTMAEWEAAGVSPGLEGLFCQEHCCCRLEATGEASSGAVVPGPMRNRSQEAGARSQKGEEKPRMNPTTFGNYAGASADERGLLANIGWTDEARAVSLTVRRAKAAARRSAAKGSAPASKSGGGPSTGSGGAGKSGGKGGEEDESMDSRATDYLRWFEEEGMVSMTPEAIDALTDEIRQKLADGKKPLSVTEAGFLEELTDKGYAGESDGDPIFNWQEKQAQREQQVYESTGMDFREARGKVSDLQRRASEGKGLTPEEKALVDTYNDIMGNRLQGSGFGFQGGEGDEVAVEYLANTGWTDEARVAALAVRRAKAGARSAGSGQVRGQQSVPKKQVKQPGDGRVYVGGSKYFDERTGQYVHPEDPKQRQEQRVLRKQARTQGRGC